MRRSKQIKKLQENINELQKQLDELKTPDCCAKFCQSPESILREYLPGLEVNQNGCSFRIRIKHELTSHLESYSNSPTPFCSSEGEAWERFLFWCRERKTSLLNYDHLCRNKQDRSWGEFRVYLEHFLVHCDTPKIKPMED